MISRGKDKLYYKLDSSIGRSNERREFISFLVDWIRLRARTCSEIYYCVSNGDFSV